MSDTASEQKNKNVGVQSADVVESGMKSLARGSFHVGRTKKATYHEDPVVKNGTKWGEKNKSHWYQKQQIKKKYAEAAKASREVGKTVEEAEKAGRAGVRVGMTLVRKLKSSSKFVVPVLLIGGLVLCLSGVSGAGSAIFSAGGNAMLVTSYTAEDKAITGAEDDYSAKEEALCKQIENVEATYPDYDEYQYELDEINHNPYELISYLTAVYEDFTREEVQETLTALFTQQYELSLQKTVEIRTRTETRTGTRIVTDPETGWEYEETYEYEVEVEYEYCILDVTLDNKGLGAVIATSGLSADQMKHYEILMETLGNRSYLFFDDLYAIPDNEYLDYQIPAELLTDIEFTNMIREAEKYLGYPYVWGGDTPETSFDCSGFVSWVINNSGNGWNIGRKTANGLKNSCELIPNGEAQPGDLIFFQGTYPTKGASHVAIYVGNGMMIHAGNPISYASMETDYWKKHFYCYGRIKN